MNMKISNANQRSKKDIGHLIGFDMCSISKENNFVHLELKHHPAKHVANSWFQFHKKNPFKASIHKPSENFGAQPSDSCKMSFNLEKIAKRFPGGGKSQKVIPGGSPG